MDDTPILDLHLIYQRAHIRDTGVTLTAFLADPMAALSTVAGSPAYLAWAQRHQVSATKMRRVLDGPKMNPNLDAAAYGEERHRAVAARLTRLKSLF